MSELDETGKPKDKSYLEAGLPDVLVKDIEEMKKVWDSFLTGEFPFPVEFAYNVLSSDINCMEVGQAITEEQAWYLREKYLLRKREDCL